MNWSAEKSWKESFPKHETVWAEAAWENDLYWQTHDNPLLKRINRLIRDVQRHPHDGLGAPEPLRYQWSRYWSRRITREHRLAYKVVNDAIRIAQCRRPYDRPASSPQRGLQPLD